MAIDFSENLVTIAIMGATGTGKSTIVNLLSNSGFEIGQGLLSCTPAVQVSEEFLVADRRVKLIDTPGFDDTLKTDRDILKLISSFLADQYRRDIKLHGIIYMHRISDTRMSGISRRNFNMFRSLCGDSTLKNVLIVTNMWGGVDQETGEDRERQLMTDELLFKPVLDGGARMMRHYNTIESAQSIINALLANHPQALQIQSEIVDERRPLEETRAGAQLENEALKEAMKRQQEELEEQKRIAEEAKRVQEAEAERRREEARREKEAAEAHAREAHERFMEEQRENMRREEERLRDLERQAWAEAEARQREEARLRQLQEEQARQAAAAEAERQRQQRELEELRRRQRDNDGDCKIF